MGQASRLSIRLFTLAVLELGSIGAVTIPVLHYVSSGLFQSKSIYLDMTRNLVLCKVLFTLYFHAKAPSMLMLLMIPIDRLWALHLPFSYRTRTLKTPVAISLFITLGTTVALAIPNVSTQNIVMKFPIGNQTFATSVCYTLKYYNFFIFVQSFIVEGMVTTLGLILLNTWIVIKIRMIMSHSRAIVATNQEETKSSKRQAAKSRILVAMSILYMVCYLPSCIALIVMMYTVRSFVKIFYSNFAVVTYYGYANFLTLIPMAVNILFYAKDVKFFHDALVEMIPWKRRGSDSTSMQDQRPQN